MSQAQLTIDAVRRALRRPLPGRAAQLLMAVRPRPGDRADLPRPCPKEGAVLLLLVQVGDQLMVPLTCRADTVHTHRGQISFPGGACEPHDADFRATALRETEEELGISAAAVEVLGQLTPLYVPPSQFCVYPYVGYLPQPSRWQPDPREVSEVVEAPLDALMNPSSKHIEMHLRDGIEFQVPYYGIGSHRIWGATAMMLSEFLTLLAQAGVPQACRPPAS